MTVDDCGYNCYCFCNCEESDHYAEICPFIHTKDCPVHNEIVEEPSNQDVI